MKTVCETAHCAGCMACVDACPVAAISIKDSLASNDAVINEDICINCGKCHNICPQNTPVPLSPPIAWYQGWAENDDMRRESSSGGAAAAITKAFIEQGGAVCSCVLKEGSFCFSIAQTESEASLFRGSRYVKSNPKDAYSQMRNLLRTGTKVLFIALPCQVAGAKRFLGDKYEGLFYSIDLICHGTPSIKLLESFLSQYGKTASDYHDLQFRKKAKFQIYGNGFGIITPGVSDRYSLAFLNGLCYTENCYTCRYAQINRVADITLGDSWGSDLPEQECKKGISLILCQTEKGKELLEMAALKLQDVALENAIQCNHQLAAPSKMPKQRAEFFSALSKGSRFNSLVTKALPRACFRQDVKQILIWLGLRR